MAWLGVAQRLLAKYERARRGGWLPIECGEPLDDDMCAYLANNSYSPSTCRLVVRSGFERRDETSFSLDAETIAGHIAAMAGSLAAEETHKS